jgi:hypothetical protein
MTLLRGSSMCRKREGWLPVEENVLLAGTLTCPLASYLFCCHNHISHDATLIFGQCDSARIALQVGPLEG